MRKLIITFSPLSLANFLAKTQRIQKALTSEPALTLFPDPWPDTFPSRQEITTGVTRFAEAYDAENGDKRAIAMRDEERQKLTVLLQRVAPYLESVATKAGDPSMLEATGYDLRNSSERGVSTALSAPQLSVKRGVLSGVIDGRVRRLEGAHTYEGQCATGDPNNEANWKQAILSVKASQITFAGLLPGTMYYFRVRGIGKDGAGAWSDVAGLMAV